MRRTKASLMYRRTKNLRVIQLPLGHTKLVSTDRYLGIEVNDTFKWQSIQKFNMDKRQSMSNRRYPARIGL